MDIAANQKVWNRDSVQHLIANSDKALARALWLIFQRQTASEQNSQQTIEKNGRGFNGRDASFLSDIAKRLPRYDYRMTARQAAKVRPMMRKYWRQLLEEIQKKGGVVDFRIPDDEIEVEEAPASLSVPDQAPPIVPQVQDRPQQFGMF